MDDFGRIGMTEMTRDDWGWRGMTSYDWDD